MIAWPERHARPDLARVVTLALEQRARHKSQARAPKKGPAWFFMGCALPRSCGPAGWCHRAGVCVHVRHDWADSGAILPACRPAAYGALERCCGSI